MTQLTERIPTRSRVSRVVDTGAPDAVSPSVQMEEKLRAFVVANTEKNAKNREAEKAKKELHQLMAKNDRKSLRVEVDGDTHEATIAAGESTEIDIRALYGKVDLDTFLSMVTTTQTKIKDKCGSNVLAAVSSTKVTDPSLSVKKVKH